LFFITTVLNYILLKCLLLDKNVINKSIKIYKNLENDEIQQRNSNKVKIEQNSKINSKGRLSINKLL